MIPVSGYHALLARNYNKSPSEILEKNIRHIILDNTSSPASEYPTEALAGEVENMSNIHVLEERLVVFLLHSFQRSTY